MNGGTSGRHNFTYVTTFNRVDDQVGTFHRISGFSHLACWQTRWRFKWWRRCRTRLRSLQAVTGAAIVLHSTHDLTDALANLPPGTDAVYVTPLTRLSSDDLHALADQLAQRKLPRLLIARSERSGTGILLATSSDTERTQRLARRVALDIQRIVEGDDASASRFLRAKSASLSTCTARLIGFSRTGMISLTQFSWPPKKAKASGLSPCCRR